MSNANIILLVYEGEKSEPKYIKSLIQKTDINIKGEIIETAFCNNIYGLCNLTRSFDTAEDKIYELFKKQKLKTLSNSERSIPTKEEISEIYLFFDYDKHAPNADNDQIRTMLNEFNDETEQGKLYISYPMLEALRDKENSVFKIKSGRKYKENIGNTGVENIARLDEEKFNVLILEHLKKANYLVNRKYQMPDNLIEQSDIFTQQLKQHITPYEEVAVLSALPLFYLDYKGVNNIAL
ncbi:MAG: hypothetical protein FE834_05450 [Gammaproteobacteria bacterium]|nr:hypothetical protein [Gammaproteobacteria bacterium]